MRALIDRLRKLPGSWVSPSAAGQPLETTLLQQLPNDHVQFLRDANGASVYDGYFRVFGSGRADCIDLDWWNEVETWKFAWPQEVHQYLCIGETGWGDQFAYKVEDLRNGDETVYLLDFVEMQPEKLASSFAEFVTDEFMRQAEEPYDTLTKAAMTRIGSLAWNEHVAYVPSLLLGGEEDVNCIVKVDARASMIISGDIGTQSQASPDSLPLRLETYEDSRARLRTRIVWE